MKCWGIRSLPGSQDYSSLPSHESAFVSVLFIAPFFNKGILALG